MFCSFAAGTQVLGRRRGQCRWRRCRGDFDLGHPWGAGAMPGPSWKRPSVLLAEAISARSLQHMHVDRGLPVGRSGEDLGLLGGDGGVALDEFGEDAAHGLNAQGKGVTSSRGISVTSPPSTPPWMAAPMATHSSGLMPLYGSLPMMLLTASCTAGIREEPPTISTLCSSLAERPSP